MKERSMDQSEWMPQQGPATTLEEMDELIQQYRKARDEYDEAKRISGEKHAVSEELKQQVINALKSNNRTKYEVEGVGLVYISTKETYETPKTAEQKQALYDYIKGKYGEAVLIAMQGINHQTLNSWANKEIEADPTLRIPGLLDPTSEELLSLRRK
jgi:DNA repair photolyase